MHSSGIVQHGGYAIPLSSSSHSLFYPLLLSAQLLVIPSCSSSFSLLLHPFLLSSSSLQNAPPVLRILYSVLLLPLPFSAFPRISLLPLVMLMTCLGRYSTVCRPGTREEGQQSGSSGPYASRSPPLAPTPSPDAPQTLSGPLRAFGPRPLQGLP